MIQLFAGEYPVQNGYTLADPVGGIHSAISKVINGKEIKKYRNTEEVF